MGERLRESLAPLTEGALQSDGSVLVHIIRPGVGTGKGTHIYPREVLRRDAHVFTGAKMYMNHLSETKRKELGSLPRGPQDLGGHVVESWWDDDVPADDRFEQGAVVARVKPTRFMRELIEDVPEAVAVSINTDATSVRPTSHQGRKAMLVEGIQPPTKIAGGSVDWVTDAGCGGRLAALRESHHDLEKEDLMAEFDSMPDEDLAAYLREERPELLEALGLTAEGEGGTPPKKTTEEETVPEITADALREALATDEGRKLLVEAARPLILAEVAERLADESDDRAAEGREVARRQIELRDLAVLAGQLVEADRVLPRPHKDRIRAMFELSESGDASPRLKATFPDFDGEGVVTKTAREKLEEAVQEQIREHRLLHAASNPTTVRTPQAAAARKEPVEGEAVAEVVDGETTEHAAPALVESFFSEIGVPFSVHKLYGTAA